MASRFGSGGGFGGGGGAGGGGRGGARVDPCVYYFQVQRMFSVGFRVRTHLGLLLGVLQQLVQAREDESLRAAAGYTCPKYRSLHFD